MTPRVELTPRRVGFAGWYREAIVDGRKFYLGVERGKRVRIPYKPRGPGAYGFRWNGVVRDDAGKTLWSGEVGKSLGARGLLRAAGVLPGKDPR